MLLSGWHMMPGPASPFSKALLWRWMQAHGRAATADLGASVITGIDGNPLAVLAKQLQIPLHDINTANVPLYLAGGEEAAAELDAEV